MAFLLVRTLTRRNTSRTLWTFIAVLEVVLLSAGIISTIVIIKGAVLPAYSRGDAVLSTLAEFGNSIGCLFSSTLFICIIINAIVIGIAASSFSTTTEIYDNDEIVPIFYADEAQISEYSSDETPPPSPPREVCQVSSEKDTLAPPRPSSSDEARVREIHEIKKLPGDLSSPFDKEKMVASNDGSIGNEEDITMEATWKAIMGEGRGRPKKKHLKKSETWDVPPRTEAAAEELAASSTPQWKELRKLETFDEAMSMRRRGGLIRPRREPSATLEEFNHQVEAFINTVNQNIRLQRQESDKRFLERINRGQA